MSVVVIRIPKRSFVIGSHGLTLLDHDYGRILGANSWLPIAHDVAVGATAFPDREFLTVLDESNDSERTITAFNRATANGSKVIAGESEVLVAVSDMLVEHKNAPTSYAVTTISARLQSLMRNGS